MIKSFKTFLKESVIEEYVIPLQPDEISHFKIAIELNDKIKKQFKYEVALVGGACRDLFYRKFFGSEVQSTIDDLDFSIYRNNVGLTAIELTKLMEFIRNTGDYDVVDEIKFLHLKAIHKSTKKEIEFTSTRKEAYRDDSRKPDTAVGSLLDDIMRRDFTVNAVYLNINKINGDLLYVSPSNPQIQNHIKDIQNKILRTTTENPETVFEEDPLRVLRGVRFAGYGYDMEPKLNSVVMNYPGNKIVGKVSIERISDELSKILKKGSVDYLIKNGFINKFITEFDGFNGKEYKEDTLNHIVDVIKVARAKAPEDKKLLFLLAALYHDIGKGGTKTHDSGQTEDIGQYNDKKQRWTFFGHESESAKIADKSMRELKFSNRMISDVVNLVQLHMETKFFADKPLKTIMTWVLQYDNQEKYPDLIDNVLLFNEIDWGGKSEAWRTKNKELMQSEVINKKVNMVRNHIRKIKQEYAKELRDISVEVGQNKNILNSSKAGAIRKLQANFIMSKMEV